MRPGRQHQVLHQPAFVHTSPGIIAIHDQHDRERRASEMTGELTALRQGHQGRTVPHHDQVPGLGVLGRPRPPTRVEDVEQDVVRDLPVGKLAHGPQRSDQLGLAHRPSLSVCFTNAAKDMGGIVTIASRYGFAETVTRLRSEIERRQLTLFIAIDQQQEAARAGLRLRPTTLLLFGNPAAGTRVMQASPEAAIDLPLKILVWEDETNRVWVAVNDGAYLQRRHALSDDMRPVLSAASAVVETALS